MTARVQQSEIVALAREFQPNASVEVNRSATAKLTARFPQSQPRTGTSVPSCVKRTQTASATTSTTAPSANSTAACAPLSAMHVCMDPFPHSQSPVREPTQQRFVMPTAARTPQTDRSQRLSSTPPSCQDKGSGKGNSLLRRIHAHPDAPWPQSACQWHPRLVAQPSLRQRT